MVKNVILTVYTVLFVLLLVGLATDRLSWNRDEKSPEDILQQALGMFKPEVLTVGEAQILYVPSAKLSGRNWSIKPVFYTYEEGTLKPVQYGR